MIPERCSDGDLLAYEELRSSVTCDCDAVGSCLGFQSLVVSILSESGTSCAEDSLRLGSCEHDDKQMVEQEHVPYVVKLPAFAFVATAGSEGCPGHLCERCRSGNRTDDVLGSCGCIFSCRSVEDWDVDLVADATSVCECRVDVQAIHRCR